MPGMSFDTQATAMWLEGSECAQPDTYVAFRGRLALQTSARVVFHVLGAHWFGMWLDGTFLTEGPARFPQSHPEYEIITRDLAAGEHVLAALVHNQGLPTRMLQGNLIKPFLWCQVYLDGQAVPVSWRAARLEGYIRSGQRHSPQFAWIEWADTRKIPENWRDPAFDDRTWEPPLLGAGVAAPARPLEIGTLRQVPKKLTPLAEGVLIGPFEGATAPLWKQEGDVSWYERNLHPTAQPTGVWRRYDLGRVRLGKPEFTLDLPAGAVVEFAYSEALHRDPIVDGYSHETVIRFAEPDATRDPRVVPYIPLSLPVSRNLDHYIARGGPQVFSPLTPKGGRFLEVHIQADPARVKFVAEKFIERCYHGDAEGSFSCDDRLLNEIWQVGVETLKGCTEDAVTDNPARERGQWTGDLALSIRVAAAAYNDLRLFRRGLQHSAYSARPDGLVAGLCPGEPCFVSTYAAYWVTTVLGYHQLTGDQTLLKEMYPYALANLSAIENAICDAGISAKLAWTFIDWGYTDSPGPAETGLNLCVLEALRSMVRWAEILQKDASPFRARALWLEQIVRAWLEPLLTAEQWQDIGYHRTVMALRLGLIAETQKPASLAYLKGHILANFPNNLSAPRLEHPGVHESRLITPYFFYHVAPFFVAAGQMDFVLDQFRVCWGWGIQQGLSTCPEVFDLGWSHCHVWSAAPTAQLSKYALGLTAEFGLGRNHFVLTLAPGSLQHASGRVPFPNGSDVVTVAWQRTTDRRIEMHVECPQAIWIHVPGHAAPLALAAPTKLSLAQRSGRWELDKHAP